MLRDLVPPPPPFATLYKNPSVLRFDKQSDSNKKAWRILTHETMKYWSIQKLAFTVTVLLKVIGLSVSLTPKAIFHGMIFADDHRM